MHGGHTLLCASGSALLPAQAPCCLLTQASSRRVHITELQCIRAERGQGGRSVQHSHLKDEEMRSTH